MQVIASFLCQKSLHVHRSLVPAKSFEPFYFKPVVHNSRFNWAHTKKVILLNNLKSLINKRKWKFSQPTLCCKNFQNHLIPFNTTGPHDIERPFNQTHYSLRLQLFHVWSIFELLSSFAFKMSFKF